jgi:sialate O-acetylesterase
MRLAAATLACLGFVGSAAAQKRCPSRPSPITPGRSAGTDYAGPNISVNVVQSRDDCCAECSENPNCTMAVWYNHEPQLCALKADIKEQRALKGNTVEAILPLPYTPPPPPFRFSNIYTSHAVLQSAPARSAVWGFCTKGDTVTVTIADSARPGSSLTFAATTPEPGRWKVLLPPMNAGFAAHTITAKSTASGVVVVLTDILFGDVWVCSGQSNMAYALNGSNGQGIVHPAVNDSKREFADMANYPHVRLYRAAKNQPNTSAAELLPASDGGDQNGRPPVVGWSVPNGAVRGAPRVDFSSVCWFFGRDMYAALEAAGKERPVGLVGVYRGGSADELWSTPDALDKCLDPDTPRDPEFSTLWNGMIAPLLQTTIKGAVWYQGEADARHPGGRYDGYACTFPAMIQDWREKWSAASNGAVAADFPFGFVQLNSITNDTVYDDPPAPALNATTGSGTALGASFGYAGLRWAQTLTKQTVPNTFMAISVDTPDSPYPQAVNGIPGKDPGFGVHSPFKQPSGARLARAALALLEPNLVDTAGPEVMAVKLNVGSNIGVTITGESQGILPLRSSKGFEVLSDGVWHSVTAVVTGKATLSIALGSASTANPKALRYNWYSNPCGDFPFGCAVYVRVTPLDANQGPLSGEKPFLPLPPFWAEL